MLKSEKQELVRQLRDLNISLDKQAKAIIDAQMEEEDPFVTSVEDIYRLRNPDGSYILVPVLVAKAQTLNALVHLNKE